MKKALPWLCLILVCGGCGAPAELPFPKDHPAIDFYRTANSFYVVEKSCSKLEGSLEIRPDRIGPGLEYEKLEEFAPGVYRVRQVSTGREWVTVYFLQYSMAAGIPKACSWDTARFPIEKRQ
jgi:hypothetical protein